MKKTFLIITLSLFVLMQAASAQRVIQLYNEIATSQNAPRNGAEVDSAKAGSTITVYLPTKETATGIAILVIPGGGYGFLATDTEGTPIAKAFAERGITAFVLKYRLPDKDSTVNKSNGPLMDAQQALKIVKEKAKDYGYDMNSVGVIGFSQGGHLAAVLGTQFNKVLINNPASISLRPAFMLLVYPVISMKEGLTYMGGRINLLGDKPTREQVSWFSPEQNVSWQTPPTYLTHTTDDGTVSVQNSVVMYQALAKEKIKTELHIYPEGNHGFIQRLPIAEWIDPMLLFIKKCGF